MSVLTRYLLRNFSIILVLVLPGLIGFYLLVDVFERLDDFVEAGAPMSSALAYFFLRIPRITYELAPISILLAGLLSIMLLSKHMELLAFRTLGVKPWKIILPLLFAAFSLSAVLVILQAFFIPKAIAKAQTIWQVDVKKNPPKGILHGNRLFYLGNKSIWTTELGSPDAHRLVNVQWLSFNRDYEIIQFVAASEAVYSGNKWIFMHGLRRMGSVKKSMPLVKAFETLTLDLAEAPEDFVNIETPSEQMDMASLWKSVRRLKRSGYSTREQETVLWGQILYPLLGCSLLLVGLPLTMMRGRGGLAIGLGLGLIVGFATWVAWSFALTMGKTGTIPAIAAPGIVHFALISTGLVLMKRLRF